MGSKSAPQHESYSKMKDTPWIKQGRQIANIGGQGVMDNYNKVNVFDDATQRSLDARNNATYQRAFQDMSDNYTNMMNKYAAKNYNQFGTLNATGPSYITDQYRKDMQRQMDDMSYLKAANYDTLRDNELRRRYATLDMYGNMYGYGATPYQQDLMNWNTENTNKDIRYQNAMANYQANQGGGFGSILGGIAGTAIGSTFGGFGGALGSQLGSQLGGKMFGGNV